MCTKTKSASRFGYDQIPVIAKHPNNETISLCNHECGPVIFDSADDRIQTVPYYLGQIADTCSNHELMDESFWITWALFNFKAGVA